MLAHVSIKHWQGESLRNTRANYTHVYMTMYPPGSSSTRIQINTRVDYMSMYTHVQTLELSKETFQRFTRAKEEIHNHVHGCVTLELVFWSFLDGYKGKVHGHVLAYVLTRFLGYKKGVEKGIGTSGFPEKVLGRWL